MTEDRTTKPAIVPRDTVLPPPRPGVRYVGVPFVGVVIADDQRRRRVDRFFHWPMIVLALAVLPLLVIEVFKRPEGGLRLAVEIGFGIIWLAFLVEFIVKIAIAESRVEYVRRNWLDVVIIVVPVLRPLRAARVTKTARVLKLRGVGMKVARYLFTFIIGMEATERMLRRVGLRVRTEEKDPKDMTRYELMDEVKRLRRLAFRWEAWYDEEREHLEVYGGETLPEPPEGVAPAPDPGGEACAGSPEPRAS